MSILHISNTFFEWELAGLLSSDLGAALQMGPVVWQLQFLPLAYAKMGEKILVTDLPEEPGPFVQIDSPPLDAALDLWGHSHIVAKWAKKHKIPYEMPHWDVVQKVNSKVFSFEASPLPGARLLYPGDLIPPGVLLKTVFGTGGVGHLSSDHPKAHSICKKQWDLGLPILAEPFVEPVVELSSQWSISKEGEIALLGLTHLQSSPTGVYLGNIVGDTLFENEHRDYYDTHLEKGKKIIETIAKLGFFGEVGIDAMIYRREGKLAFQPILEINARKTMGWVALRMREREEIDCPLTLSYTPGNRAGLLPQKVGTKKFSRQVNSNVH